MVAGLTIGDASTVVRSAAMGEAGKSGLWVLKQLQKRCNPRTIGRRLKALMGVVAPSPVKSMGEVVRKVEEWELGVKKVEAEYGEPIPGSMQVAVLISMLPKELQDIAFQLSKDGEELEYKEVRGRVLGVAMNRVQERVPQMGKSVYGVGEGWDWGGADAAGEDYGWGREAEVDALGKGNAGVACYRCGGKSHMAKECSTPAGMVEGGKGKGKDQLGKGKGPSGAWHVKGGEWKGGKGSWKGSVGGGGKNV